MARPLKRINWREVEKLCKLQCLEEEIAQWCGVNVETLDRACHRDKGRGFREFFAQNRGIGKIPLRRVQMQTALKGQPAMLIWLGKQMLGQKDKHEVSGPEGGPMTVKVVYEEKGPNGSADQTPAAAPGPADRD